MKIPPLITIDGLPASSSTSVSRPFDFSQLFYIDVPTSKWNSRVLYHIFRRLGVKNTADFIWDPKECHALYIIKDSIVYKSPCNIYQINQYPDIVHPDFDPENDMQNVDFQLNRLEKASIITGIDNWIQLETYNGQIFDNDALMQDKNNTELINAMVDGFTDYCRTLNVNVICWKTSTITNIACCDSHQDWVCCIDKQTGKRCKVINGDTAIHSTNDAFRYITIETHENNGVCISVCTSFAKMCTDGSKSISVKRRHGVGYQLINYPKNAAVSGFIHCEGKCVECKKLQCRYENPTSPFDSVRNDINLRYSVADMHRYECMEDGIEHADIKCVGGFTTWFDDPIYPRHNISSKIHESDLNSHKNPIYNSAEEISKANDLKTKTQSIMSAPNKNTGLFERMLNKYMAQYKPEKIEGLALTMDGNIALPNGQDEFIAIVDEHLENYPAEAVIQDVPFYSVHRQLDQIKVGDYVFLTTTAEGRKLAKVTFVNKTKDGQPKGLTVLRFSGAKDETAAITDKLTGLTTVEVVVNLFENLQLPGMGGNNQMNPFMMLAIMKDGFKGEGIEKIMMMSMMMGGNNGFNFQFPGMGGNGQMNPFMMMSIMKDGFKGEDFEKFMMMSMMMGGNNPFAPMNPAPVEQAPARKTRSDKGTSRKPAESANAAGKVEEPVDAE